MNFFTGVKFKKNGFSLIEILVAVVISSIGLLSLGVFQSNLLTTSAESKARIEGATVCQAQIEKYREYTFNSDTDWFNPDMDTGTAGVQTSITISGNNAVYTIARTSTVTIGTAVSDGSSVAGTNVTALATGDTVKQVDLNLICSWTDSDNTVQSITLNSIMTFSEPSAVANYTVRTTETDIDSPTGRAYIGEGTLVSNGLDPDKDISDYARDRDDNTQTYEDDENLYLIDIDEELAEGVTHSVVLTLEKACSTESGICTDFVEIHGRIYLDSNDVDHARSVDKFTGLYLKSSGAAYCKLWADVGYSTTNPMTTENDDYEYMNYTCYLGGGWYGNIGLLLSGGVTTKDKMCMGDPNYADKLAHDSLATDFERVTQNALWTKPSLAIRRAYRGFKYQVYDPETTNDPSVDDWLVKTDAHGDIIYTSIGIRDAARLYNQDFVLLYTNDTDDGICYQSDEMSLSLTDSENYHFKTTAADGVAAGSRSGLLFANTPGDFVCLNNYIDVDDNGHYLATVTNANGDITTPSSVHPVQENGDNRPPFDPDNTDADDVMDYEQLYVTAIGTLSSGVIVAIKGIVDSGYSLARDEDQNGAGVADVNGDTDIVNYVDVDIVRDDRGKLPPPIDLDMRDIDDLDDINDIDLDVETSALLKLANETLDTVYVDYSLHSNYSATSVTEKSTGDYYYRAKTICRYDPTHAVATYTIPITNTNSAGISSALIDVKSSTGEACTGPDPAENTADLDYSCTVYASIIDDVAEEWDGTVTTQVVTVAGGDVVDTNYTCSPSPTTINIDTAGTITGTTTVDCGNLLYIQGTITDADGKLITDGITLDGVVCDVPGDGTYTCTTPFFDTSWAGGDVELKAYKTHKVCNSNTPSPNPTVSYVQGSDAGNNITTYSFPTGATDDIEMNIVVSDENTPLTCP